MNQPLEIAYKIAHKWYDEAEEAYPVECVYPLTTFILDRFSSQLTKEEKEKLEYIRTAMTEMSHMEPMLCPVERLKETILEE